MTWFGPVDLLQCYKWFTIIYLFTCLISIRQGINLFLEVMVALKRAVLFIRAWSPLLTLLICRSSSAARLLECLAVLLLVLW